MGNKKKMHNKIHMLTESKLNSIEKLISRALSDMEINHEECNIILDEKDRYVKMKYKITNENNIQFELYIIYV